jgi:hypothetical protein
MATFGTFGSTYGPTETLKRSLKIAGSEFIELKRELENILNLKLPELEKEMIDAGAPWVVGQPIPEY